MVSNERGLCPPAGGGQAFLLRTVRKPAPSRPLKKSCWPRLPEISGGYDRSGGISGHSVRGFGPAYTPTRILNIHPALIPSFAARLLWLEGPSGGAGLHGVKVTGATVHFCQPRFPTGEKSCCKRRWIFSLRHRRRPSSGGPWSRPNGSCCRKPWNGRGETDNGGRRMNIYETRPWAPHCGQPMWAGASSWGHPRRTAGGRRLFHHGPQRQQPEPGVHPPGRLRVHGAL